MARVGWTVFTLLSALGVAGCSGQTMCNMPSCMTVKDPPQVFLIAPETNQIGTDLKLKANVVGCTKITQIQILNGTKFLLAIDSPAKVPVDVTLPPSTFNTLYQTVGIAAKLTLVAKGVCDDGRTNKSTPVGVSFFPVASVTPPGAGNSAALPDIFVAEGGVAGAPTTFVGCVGTATGTGLARFDTMGNAINANLTLPFPCSYNSIISDKNPATGFRWLLEPGVGVFSFDSSGPQKALDIKAYAKGDFAYRAIGPDGDAIVWDSKSMFDNLFKYSKSGGAAEIPLWHAKSVGIMAGTPVVSQNEVYVVMWFGTLGSGSGTMLVQKFVYGGATGGSFVGESMLVMIEYDNLSAPKIPPSTFSADGTIVYFAYQNTAGTRNTSGIVACASNASGCGPGNGAKWASPLVDDVIAAAVPFSSGAMIAAVGAKSTYFLSSADGHIVNVYGLPIQPDGNLVTMSVQPGTGTDFYIMNGASTGGFPTEIVAIDSPLNGELWRVQTSGGDVPSSAVSLAIDEGNNVWLRIQEKQVRPLTLSQYRMVKGANLQP